MPSRQLTTSASASNYSVSTPLYASICSFLFIFMLCLRKRKRTTPTPTYSDSHSNPPQPFSFPVLRRATNSFSTPLGHGGFGTVFSGTLGGDPVAVKLMDSLSLQGEREFHNELFFASILRSPLVVPAIGFSSDPKRRRFVLVYHLMHNGNLHDALLRKKLPHLTPWKNRFSIILHVAKAIHYLHSLDPPVIHGDIKPSNILLDTSFSPKLADFGLSRFKSHTQLKPDHDSDRNEHSHSEAGSELDTHSVNTDCSLDDAGLEHVMDWIGKDVKKEKIINMNNGSAASSSGTVEKEKKKKKNKKLEWWESMGMDHGGVSKKEKRRPAREWWREEYSEELERKRKKKKKNKRKGKEDDMEYKREKERKRSGSVDWWLSGWNSYDSGSGSGDIVGKSSGVSMRGTVLYVAPEYGCNGEVSEKCDVYSFGVLLLVIVSGRRPLEVTGWPRSEFERGNLVCWARQCGRKGKVLDVVDQSVEGLDKEQASLCVTVALMCLLNSPASRPSIDQVLRILTGEIQPPQLPLDHSRRKRPSQSLLNTS